MKIWTYAEARQKVLTDQELVGEDFVTPAMLIGFFNEGIESAEAEILLLDEDYLLTSAAVPLVLGTAAYAYPANMYAYKLRGVIYSNNSNIYEVKKFRRKNKFSKIAMATAFATVDDYMYYHTNDTAGNARFNLIPPARETATPAPNTTVFTPMIWWYIRQANRIPILGEYIPLYDTLLSSAAVDPVTDTIVAAGTYVTGDQVKVSTTGALPAPLAVNTVYYAIVGGAVPAGKIALASTAALAAAGTKIDLTTAGTGFLLISLAANQTIIDNTVIDIPEFITYVMQFAKCAALSKEGLPTLAKAVEKLEALHQSMVETLKQIQQDDDTTIEMDLSHYREMS